MDVQGGRERVDRRDVFGERSLECTIIGRKESARERDRGGVPNSGTCRTPMIVGSATMFSIVES